MQKGTLKQAMEERLDQKFPGFKQAWHDLVLKLGDDLVNLLKNKFQDEYTMFKEISQFQISVVIDNNFIFGQIKNLVEKNKPLEQSFVYRIANLKSIRIYAPPKMREELYDKIETVLNTNNALARQYADLLLQRIEIKDAQWINEWKRANNLIGHIDADDVPYLALAIDVGSHAIISRDKIFHQQGIAQVWTIHDADQVVTNYNKGFVSFCFLGASPNIIQIIWEVFVAIFRVLGEILILMLEALTTLIVGGVYLLTKIPAEIWAILSFIWLMSEDFQKATKDAMIKFREMGLACLEQIKKFIDWLAEFVKSIIDIFVPVGVTTLEFIGYFTAEFMELQLYVEHLEKNRTK